MSSHDRDYTLPWPDLQKALSTSKKPARTAEEEQAYKERKARELRVMLERAEVALEGNRKLFDEGGKKKKKGRVNAMAMGGSRQRGERNGNDWFFRG